MPPHEARRTYSLVVVGAALLVAALWAATLERIDHERRETIHSGVRQHSNLALAFEEHSIRTLKGLDRIVRFVQHEYLEHGQQLSREYLVDEGQLDLTALTTLGVIDERGEIVVSLVGAKGVNVADRDYFEYHRASPDRELRIGIPAMGRLSGRQAIHLTRRIEHRDGSFAGVAVVGVDPQYFADFYNHVDLGARGLIMLVGLDGHIRARRAGLELSAGQDLANSTLFRRLGERASGDFVSVGGLDGIQRYLSYRRVREFPLLVAVGAAREDVLAPFIERRANYLLGASLASVFIAGFAALLLAARRRQRADRAARVAEEARYRTTFDQAPVGIAHATREGRFLKVNPKLCELLGYSEPELLRLGWRDVTHPEDARRTMGLIDQALGTAGAPLPELEKRYRRKDGTLVYGLATLAAVRDAKGAPDYIVTMLRDISKRRHAEAELRESEARFRSLTELSSDFYWETDAEHRLVQRGSGGKPTAVRAFAEGRQLGLRRWEVAYLSPGDEGWREHRAELDAHRPFRHFEISRAGDDGSERFISLSGDPIFDAAGAFKGHRGVGTDITERRRREKQLQESERRFRDMLGKMQLVSLMLDRDARIHYCNDYLLELTGWTREEVVGRDWFELFIPGDAPGMRQVFADLLRNESDAWHHENEILTRPGARRMVRWNNTVLRSISGEVIGTASIGEDITEQKAAGDQLRDQLDELRRFQKVTVDRELRLQQVEAELRAARTGLTA